MTHQELELWVQDIIEDVLNNRHVEDSKVELKSFWPEAEKAAPILAAHANAARGESILWLIGLDEKGQELRISLRSSLRTGINLFNGGLTVMLLVSLDLTYKESRRTDQFGNRFRYRAKVRDVHNAQLGRWAWDVFLVQSP